MLPGAQVAWGYLVETKGYPPENLTLRSILGAAVVYLQPKDRGGQYTKQFYLVPDMGVSFSILPVRWFVHKDEPLARMSNRCPLIILHSKTDNISQLPRPGSYTKGLTCQSSSFSAPHFSKIGSWSRNPDGLARASLAIQHLAAALRRSLMQNPSNVRLSVKGFYQLRTCLYELALRA
jgi:hypothetical protein